MPNADDPPNAEKKPSLPDFLVIGAMKAGTTSLYHDLRQQSGVFLPDKESNALLADNPALAFASLFEKAISGAARGEVCPDYTKPGLDLLAANHARELFAGNSPPLLIYLVRDPIQRLISHHYFVSTQHGDANPGGMTADLESSLRDFPELIETSRYTARLSPWIEAFGKDSLRIIRFEDYIADRAGTVRSILEDLGRIDSFSPDSIRPEKIHNRSSSRPVATPFWRRIMKNPAYRKLLRPLIPIEARDRIRSLILPKAPPAPPAPSAETLNSLIEVFGPEIAALSELTGVREPLWELEANDHPR